MRTFGTNRFNPVIKLIVTKGSGEYEFYTDYDIDIKDTPIIIYSIIYNFYSGARILRRCKTSIEELENVFDSIRYEYKRRDRVWNSITS